MANYLMAKWNCSHELISAMIYPPNKKYEKTMSQAVNKRLMATRRCFFGPKI